MSDRAVSLGVEGERAWEALRSHHLLERRRGIALVLSDHPGALDEVRRRLTVEAPRLVALTPSESVVAQVLEVGRTGTGPDGELPVAWIEAPRDTAVLRSPWDLALASLNVGREQLSRHGAVFVVLAGPQALHGSVVRGAPDLYSVTGSARVLPEAPGALRTGAGPISWLHLSDLHVQGRSWEQDRVLARLRTDLPRLLGEAQIRPDLVFATGDLSQAGQPDELDGAHGLLGAVMKDLRLDPTERLFVVPGNHDVSRGAIGRLVKRDQAAVRELQEAAFQDELRAIWADRDTLRQYGVRLDPWCTFTRKLLGLARGVEPDRLWRTDVRRVGGLDVGVASLCSAWMCGPERDEAGRIVLGERQVAEAMDEISGCPLRIALLHHPLDWLHTGERRAVRELLRDRAHLVLHGHLHEPDAEAWLRGHRQGAVIAAGAAYAGTRWPHGFAVGRLDPGGGGLELRFYTYSARDGGFWHLDLGAQKGADQGVHRLPLPLEGVVSATPTASSGLVARLARAAEGAYGGCDFLGVPARASAGRQAGLLDLFQPLDLAAQDKKEPVHLSEIEARLFAAGPAARLVVLGEPGSGKSTLTRYLALTAARLDPPRAPLLLPLREWVREGGKAGLLAWAAAFLSRRLSVPIDEAALASICEGGHALLLIDGLDEVASPDQRAGVRDEVASLARRFLHLPMLATSRPAGYDHAPLSAPGLEHLSLRPLNDAQIDAFVARWYEAMERDPVERAQRKADLIAAFAAEPRARELARNPLLATLIALVHQHEARLPGERARLYELVVTMLLETWPERRSQVFAELDAGRQRVALEKLALRLMERRVVAGQQGRSGQGVTLNRAALERELTGILRAEGQVGATGAPRLARRWADWLAAGTGLLVEQQAGIFGFLHLSILEFLAGRALWRVYSRDGEVAVASLVAERHDDPHWRESLLLMLGSEADRASLHEAVVERLLPAQGAAWTWERGLFLLAMLREEVELSAERVASALDVVAEAILEQPAHRWGDALAPFGDVLRFGRRSREGARRWLDQRLRRATGTQLLGALAMLPEAEQVRARGVLESRGDLQAILPDLMDQLGTRWGSWAVGLAQQRAWLRWMDSRPVEAATRRALWALNEGSVTCAAATAAVLGQIGSLGQLTRRVARAIDERPQRGRVPAALGWALSRWRVLTTLEPAARGEADAGPSPKGLPVAHLFAGEFASDFAGDFASDFANAYARCFASDSVGDFVRSFARYFAKDFASVFARYFASDFARYFASDLANDNAWDFASDFARYFTSDAAREFADRVEAPSKGVLSPLGLQVSRVARRVHPAPSAKDPWFALRAARTVISARDAALPLMLQACAELHAGFIPLLCDAPSCKDDAIALATLRIQGLWLQWFFEPLVASLTRGSGTPLPPERHALLLLLGVQQLQTTWTWPWGPTWASWFASGRPPEHWLASFAWHQCRAVGTYDPGEVRRWLDLARADLARGDWPELSARLEQLLLIPNPPEERALYADAPEGRGLSRGGPSN